MEHGRRRPAEALEGVARRARPVALAEEHLLAVLPPLAPLLPEAGLRRGTVISVDGGPGATSLALAVAAGPSAEGSWVVAVGLPDLGVLAAEELGVRLDRLGVVGAPPPTAWGQVVAALVDAVDVVLVRPPGRVRAGDARRVMARARERGSVVVLAGGGSWPEAPDVRLTVTAATWDGLDAGHGHLRARRMEVRAEGRRAAARSRRAALWLPGADGAVADAPGARPEVEVVPGAVAGTAADLREVG